MKLRLSVNGGGVGAEITTDLPDDDSPEQVAEEARRWYEALDSSRIEQLGRMRESPPRPDPPPAPCRPPADPQGQPGLRPDHRPEPRRDDDGQGRRDYTDQPPTNGKQLLAWAARHGLKDQVIDLGAKWGFADRVVDWPRDACVAAYNELVTKGQPAAARPAWGGRG